MSNQGKSTYEHWHLNQSFISTLVMKVIKVTREVNYKIIHRLGSINNLCFEYSSITIGHIFTDDRQQ